MLRLPDIPSQSWSQDQQKRFREETDGLFPSLEFALGARDAESQIPLDYDAVGGRDQWEEAERNLIEQQSREAQQAEEERRRQEQQAEEERRQQEIEQLTQQYQQEQQKAEQQQREEQQHRASSVLDMARNLGIPTPGDAFMNFKDPGNAGATTGAFDAATPGVPPSDAEAFNSYAGGMTREIFGSAPTPNPATRGEPPSDAEAFNSYAGGMTNEIFGSPTPEPDAPPSRDDTSTTGVLDTLGSGVQALRDASSRAWESSAPASWRPGTPEHTRFEEDRQWAGDRMEQAFGPGGRRWGEAGVNVQQLLRGTNETLMGSGLGYLGRVASELAGEPEIGTYAPGTRGIPLVGESLAESTVTELAAPILPLPGKAGKAVDALGGLAKAGAGDLLEVASKIAPEAIAGIKNLVASGLGDDMIVPIEQKLANDADITLSAVQKLTRETPAAGVNPAALPDEELPTFVRPEADDLTDEALEEVGDILTPPNPSSRARGLTPDEAAQLRLPGFEDAERVGEANTGRTIPGFGRLSTELGSPQGGISRSAEDIARGAIPESPHLSGEDRARYMAELLDSDPDTVEKILGRTLQIDPTRSGVEQGILRAGSQSMLELLGDAQVQLANARNAVQDALQEAGGKIAAVPDELKAEESYWLNEFASRLNDATIMLRGTSLSAQAAAKTLNAQKGGYEGALLVLKAQQAKGIGESLKQAAKSAQRVARTGVVDEEALKDLETVAKQLTKPRNRKVLTGDDAAGTGAGGTPGTGSGRVRRAKAPAEETLAERHGRLLREQGRLESILDNEMAGLDDAGKKPLQDHLADVRANIEESITEMREEAEDMARLWSTRGRNTFSYEEAERIIDGAVGRRVMSRLSREAKNEARGFNSPEAQSLKLTAEMEKALNKALERKLKDDVRLQQSIDRQINRRVDGMLAQETRAQTRREVKEMAKQAQTWAQRIRKFPEQREALQEEFDLLMLKLHEHSNLGAKVYRDLSERLQVNLEEDVYSRAFRDSRRATNATIDAHIQSVVEKIREAQANARAPDSHLRVAALFKELESLGGLGIQRASNLQRQAHNRGILKSGLFAVESADFDRVSELLQNADPTDGKSMRAIFALMRQPNAWDVAKEISFINLLSNPVTHAKNITSTLANGALKLAIRNPGEFVGSGGQTRGQRAAFQGLGAGFKEGGRLAKIAMDTGHNPRRLERAVAQGDYRHVQREFLPEIMEKLASPFGSATAKKVGGKMGEALHMMSTRPLEAMDAMLGHMAYTSAFWEKAQQHADDLIRSGSDEVQEYLTAGSKLPVREQVAQHIINNSWDFPELIKTAGKIEDYTLFRSHGSGAIESTLRRIAGMKDTGPGTTPQQKMLGMAIDFFMPFYNVPYNATKQGAGNVVAPFWNTGAAMVSKDAKTRGEHVGKAAQGAILMGFPALLAADDNLTGEGPSDRGQRLMWLQDHRPNSFRLFGGPWISYEGTPWAIPFATVAGIKESMEFRKDDPYESGWSRAAGMVGGAARGGLRGAMSQSLIEGTMRNLESIFGEQATENNTAQILAGVMSRYSPHILAAPVPSGMLNFLAQATDTVERDPGRARNLDEVAEVTRDIIKSRLPVARWDLPERRGAFGEVVPRHISQTLPGVTGWGPRENDPITDQLQRGRIGMPTAPEELTYGTGKVPLTIREQQNFQRRWGENYRILLQQWGAGQETLTEQELTRARDQARAQTAFDILGDIDLDKRWRPNIIREVAP